MFVEIYNLVGNGRPAWAEDVQRYPEISEEDWRAWEAYFPVCTPIRYSAPWLIRWLGVPVDAALTIEKVANEPHEDRPYLFDRIEVWGKKDLNKDPIAVGIRLAPNGEIAHRHLICRWGPDALLPFETIKKRAWLYRLIRPLRGHQATFLDALFALSMLFVLGRLFSMIFGL